MCLLIFGFLRNKSNDAARRSDLSLSLNKLLLNMRFAKDGKLTDVTRIVNNRALAAFPLDRNQFKQQKFPC